MMMHEIMKAWKKSGTMKTQLRRDDVQSLEIIIDNEASLYAPGYDITGIVTLKAPDALDVTSITVKFRGKSRAKSVSSGGDASDWNIHKIFERSQTLYSRDKFAREPPLAGGAHKWAFSFRFPENLACYPPSFLLIPWGRRCLAWVLYEVKAYIRGSGVSGSAKAKLMFWPGRKTRLENGPLPADVRHLLNFSLPISKDAQASKVKLSFRKPSKSVNCSVILSVPRFVILSEPMSLQMSLYPPPDATAEDTAALSQAKLTDLRLFLWARTKVGHQSPYLVADESEIQSAHHENISIPLSEERVNLHDLLPAPFVIKAEPYRNMQATGTRHYVYCLGPLCPSFETPLISRTYLLRASGTVACAGTIRRFNITSAEMILLSNFLASDLAAEKTSTAEMDQAAERDRAEAMSKEIVEMDGEQWKSELPVIGNEVVELETGPAGLSA